MKLSLGSNLTSTDTELISFLACSRSENSSRPIFLFWQTSPLLQTRLHRHVHEKAVLKDRFSTAIKELKSKRTQNYARSKIKQLRLRFLSAVDEKDTKNSCFFTWRRRFSNVKNHLITRYHHDIIRESLNRTRKIVCFKFRQPKSNVSSRVDNDNQIFSQTLSKERRRWRRN